MKIVLYINLLRFISSITVAIYGTHIHHYFYCSSTGLPDPFAKVQVDGTGQVYSTEISKSSLDPKWNAHYDLFLGRGDSVTITVWNQRKIHKGSGFLGCVRIPAQTIQSLKGAGCK